MNNIGIIPARMNSTRFPGKPLVFIDGKTMIRRVYEQAILCRDLAKVVVATDHKSILDHVLDFGGEAVMTASSHNTGTERCAEALEMIQASDNIDYKLVINIQGDEPYLYPEQISEVVRCFSDPSVSIATLVREITNPEDITDPNVVKVVFDENHQVLYFSRQAIPYIRQKTSGAIISGVRFFEHVGIYGFRGDILSRLVLLPESQLERAESLEQLRWLQYGFRIFVRETNYQSISVDSPADLRKITNRKS